MFLVLAETASSCVCIIETIIANGRHRVIANRRVVCDWRECPSRPDLASVWCWLDPFAMMVSLVSTLIQLQSKSALVALVNMAVVLSLLLC